MKTYVKTYDFLPVFATQGGGLAYWDTQNKAHVFISPPTGMGFDVGDLVPEKWSLASLNMTTEEVMKRGWCTQNPDRPDEVVEFDGHHFEIRQG